MANEVNPSRRPYRSPLRADQAEQTRRRILESAYRLFAERGYAGTTITAVAEAAGVSPETIYLSLRGKRGLLEGAIEMAIAGAEHHASREDGWWDAVAALPDPGARLEELVGYSCGVLARTRPIHAVIRGAADKETFAAELGRRLLDDRLAAQTERIRTFLADDLRPGLTVDQAGERYVALASPELYFLLTAELGWTPGAHRTWLTDLLKHELLAPGVSAVRSSTSRRASASSPGDAAPS